ncbi:uncharacterized protein LOC143057529 [Mytilus galloprovincialis]|uniref:uncharacterized protein LOC143057529 n=1 Tax=Mytilus galloprovincialis TaxID=29158 RepID=UPI003F7B812E
MECCNGYGGSSCLAQCNRLTKTSTDGACNLHYTNDSVPDRNSLYVERNSGGTCVLPNKCECCNKGFYADHTDGYCKICPYIPMCDYRSCHSPHGHGNECVYCKYENDNIRYERAYKYNTITIACEKTCSWRPDSTRCFPGYCSDEYADTCVCTEGFGSPSSHCIEITKAIDVLHAQVIFMDAENTTVSSPENVNSPRNVPKKWTNNRQLNTMEFSLGAIYNATGNIPKFGEHTDTINGKILTHYVTEFKYGIISGGMKAMLIRDHVATVSIFNENCQIDMTLTSPFPVKSEFRCQKSLKFADQFRHNDELTILVELENGGYYVYENRDDRHRYKIVKKWPTLSVNLKGIKTVESYKIHWDTELPYYYCIKSFCDSLPLYVPDTSKSRVIDVHWNNWSDDLSGVDYYEIEVFELETAGLELRENTAPVMHVKSIKGRSSKVEVTKPGIYAVHLFCFDMAGNYETARAFVLYDNNDTIDLGKGQIKVKNTKYYLERRWITDSSPLIEVEWKDIFIKTDHVKYKWLATVQPHPNILSTYDDISGKRTVNNVPNVKGIVRFEIVHDVNGTKLKSSSKFTVVSNVYAQFTVRNVTWDDGDQLKTTIRAFDILENYRDETIITYKDSTPPVISNLWLTKGDRIDTAVHSLKELNEMTIEWDAYDYHSGISQLKWRLYSNYSGINIIHGEIDLPGQGETQNFTECEEKYNVTRGPACYCTKYTGCYQKHFYIRPNIVVGEGNGIVHNKSMGEHNLDYFIDVNVTNMATLISLKTIRITVDTTPPEVGHVHDGVYGSPEVDFQQDMRLDAHWEGFFDHESGVAFYQYEFSDVCLTEEYFQRKSLINDTVNTFATYDAPSPGTYYITVVAYNKAFHMSKPVCSDGVTITTTIPSVKNVIIMNARTKPRIVRETDGHEWYIDETLQRHYLENSTSKCKFSDPLTENIEVFPISQSPVYADNVCMKTNSYSTLVTRVVPKIHMLNITWESVVDASLIDDYEVGFSKVSGSTAPELMAFQSSKHHTHILINHFGVPEGMLFFIIIKSISKSYVKGSQSVGPFILDTTPPQFVGTYIDLYLSGNNLLANWSAASFIDSDNPFSLDYEYALGHEPYSADIQHYSLVPEEGSCSINSNYICIATDITELDWKLHGHHKYYVTIKATNLAGLFVLKASVPYIHDIVLPSKGIVIDVPGNSSTFTPIKDMEDIDYTTIRDHLAIRWRKFYHPHLNLTYYACVGTASGICDVAGKRKIGSNINFYLVTGLSLYPLLRYYSTVFAETLTGSASVSSDGVTIVDPNWSLPDLKIHDGENCTDVHCQCSGGMVHDRLKNGVICRVRDLT